MNPFDYAIQRTERKIRLKRNYQTLRDMKDAIRHTNTLIIRVPEGKKRKEMSRIHFSNNGRSFSHFDEKH